MAFFHINNEIKTEDLKLSDYNQICSKFCFLDETGSLHNVTDPFFTVGIIKMSQPCYLMSKLSYERQKWNFHDEIKFNKLSRHNIGFAKFAFDAMLGTRSVDFYSYSVDKDGEYFKREFGGDPWRAYERITLKLLQEAVLAPKEILILLADYVTVPNYVRFEVEVKKKMNTSLARLALVGVCRIDSRANDLLQLVDLMVGAISYDLKIETGAVKAGDKHKREFLDFFKRSLGVEKFIRGFRNRDFNIFVDKDMRMRLPLPIFEKGPSS